MLFQRKIDGAMKKLHEGSDAAEEERRKEAGEPYEEMERPELEKGDIPAMIIAHWISIAICLLSMPHTPATIITGAIFATNIAKICCNPNGIALTTGTRPSNR